MDYRNHWRLVDADEEDIIAILPPRKGSHVSTSQEMPRPQLRREFSLKSESVRRDREPWLQELHRYPCLPNDLPFSGERQTDARSYHGREESRAQPAASRHGPRPSEPRRRSSAATAC
jgi:hypothetical protein